MSSFPDWFSPDNIDNVRKDLLQKEIVDAVVATGRARIECGKHKYSTSVVLFVANELRIKGFAVVLVDHRNNEPYFVNQVPDSVLQAGMLYLDVFTSVDSPQFVQFKKQMLLREMTTDKIESEIIVNQTELARLTALQNPILARNNELRQELKKRHKTQ